MRELQRKQKIIRILYSLPFLALFLFLTVFIAKGAIVMLGNEQDSAKRVEELETRAATLALREEDLESKIKYLQTDDGLEDEIRERFSVTRAGEHVAIIIDEKEDSDVTDESDLPWYKRIWHAIW